MFPLAGNQFPQSADELAKAIQGVLAQVFSLPAGAAAVVAQAGAFPVIQKLVVNLDNAGTRPDAHAEKPEAVGPRTPGVQVNRLEVRGRPIRHESSKLDFDLTADAAKFDFARTAAGKPIAVLTAAQSGEAKARITKADLQTLLLNGAAAAAKAHGVTVQDVQVDLKSLGPRSVTADVRVKAKAMMMSGVVRFRGQVDVDDQMNAVLHGLDCVGEGMVGNMAAGAVKGKLKSYEGKQVPLLAFSLGDVRLKDLKLDATDGLAVSATFGSTVA